MVFTIEDVFRLVFAVLVGGAIGAEREFRDKAAGFRTIIFISVGATLFTIFSLKLGGERDPVRIAANIVTGVGFLGAGTILRDAGRVVGLTTASTIWVAAALGMGIGGGYVVFSAIATGIVLVVLWIFPWIERWIDNIRHARTYEIVTEMSTDTLARLQGILNDSGLRAADCKISKSDDQMVCTWEVHGSPRKHQQLIELLFAMPEVREFRY